MEWTYKINALARPRLLMRVAQVFDQQSLVMRWCVMTEAGGRVDLRIGVVANADVARRVHAKLYKCVDIDRVDLEGDAELALPSEPPYLVASA